MDGNSDGGDNGYKDLPVVRMDEERSVVFLIRSLREISKVQFSSKDDLTPARTLDQWTQPTLQVGHVVQHLCRRICYEPDAGSKEIWFDERFTIWGKKDGCNPTSSLMLKFLLCVSI